jgi:phage minor structural protein
VALMQSIYILNENEIPVAVLNPELPEGCPFYDDVLTRRLEYGYMTFEFEVPADHPVSNRIATNGYVVYPYTKDGSPYYFRILETTETNGDGYRKKVFCENAAVDDLLGNPVRPATLNSYTLEQAINYVLAGSDWVCGDVEFAGVKDIKIDDYMTSLEALHKVLDTFGAEIEFHVQFEGLRVMEKKVSAVIQRGKVTRKPFVYSLDLMEVERIEDTTNLVTAMIGVGKGDTTGQFFTFANYTPPGLDTTKYEKPAGADWVGSLEAFQRWGKKGRHIFGIHRDDQATNPVELFQNTLNALDKYSKPLYTYRVGMVLLADLLGLEAHEVDLGDTVTVKDTTFQPELILEARIIEMKESVRDPSKNEVTLGEFRPISITENQRIRDIQRRLDQKEALWDQVKYARGTGAHVIANTPKPLTNGQYTNFNHYLIIQVTENVHLGYASVYCDTAGQSGIVELQDGNGNTLERREYSNLVQGENRLKLDLLLREDVGTYRLYGDFSGNTWRTDKGLQYPYESGSFKITGTSSTSGYWYHFYDISIGGPGVKGTPGQEILLGDMQGRYGKIVAYDSDGETIAVIDNKQIVLGSVVATEVQAPNLVTSGIPAGETISYFVNAVTGEDGNDGSSSKPFASVAAAIQKIPRVFDGEVKIHLQSDIVEDITLSGFLGTGKITILMNGYTMTGRISIQSVKLRVSLYGGGEATSGIYGRINAKAGETTGVIQVYHSDYVGIFWVKVYGISGGSGSTGVLTTYDNSFVYCANCEFYNARSACVYSAYGGKTMVVSCVGSGAPYGVWADYAGYIGWATQIPDGTGNPIRTTNGGMVNPATVGGGQSGGGTGGTTPTAPTVSVWNSSSGDSWRTVFNDWRGDGKVIQGMWRSQYGHHTGLWLYPSGMSSTVTGKTIKRIRTYLQRLSGGNATVTITLRMHGHASKPGGQPSVLAPALNVTFKVGEAKWVDLPSSWFSYFSSGLAKGMGLYTNNTTDDYYAVFDDSAKIEITYVP